MITFETNVHVSGLSGTDITDFLCACDDDRYSAWWPGTHLQMHTLDHLPGRVGSMIYMDEFIGAERVRMTGMVVDLISGRRLVWQAFRIVPLPFRVFLELQDTGEGVTICHRIQAGYDGVGRVLDPLLRLHFNRRFGRDMDAHVKEEFPRLCDLLARERQSAPA